MDDNTRRLLPEEYNKGGPSRREIIEWEENYASIESAEDEKRFLRGKRRLNDIIGSEMLMRVNITFDSRPTPSEELVRKRVQNIMKDLNHLVNNLTATDDPELEGVYMAIRQEVQTLLPSSFSPSEQHQSKFPSLSPLLDSYAPSKTDLLIIGKPSIGNAVIKNSNEGVITTPEKQNVLLISLITAITITTFFAAIIFLLFRFRRRNYNSGEDVSEEIDHVPRHFLEDSIFSGLTDISADGGSPNVRPNKSMSSAITVKAANQRQYFKRPSSMATSTLFAFSEEGEDNISHSDMDHQMIKDRTPLSPNSSGPSSTSMKSLEVLSLETIDSMKNNKSIKSEEEYDSPLRFSPDMDESQPYDFGLIVTDTRSSALERCTQTGVGVTDTSTKQKEISDYINLDNNFTPSSMSERSARSTYITFPSDKREKNKLFDWSYHNNIFEECSLSSKEEGKEEDFPLSLTDERSLKSVVHSPSSRSSKLTFFSDTNTSESKESKGSELSTSHQFLNDLVWLEKKIAESRTTTARSPFTGAIPISSPIPELNTADSMSYNSADAPVSDTSSHGDTTVGSNGILQNIICRDCFTPPGKLQIILHSTKDGPAVHTVKEGSSLEGHIFPGDLIIGLDNVDTRTSTAEQVMKAMAAKSDFDRKITVLHYEE